MASKDAVRTFDLAMKAKTVHAKLYGEALASLEAQRVQTTFYVCLVCSEVTDNPEETEHCPICNALKEKFVAIRWTQRGAEPVEIKPDGRSRPHEWRQRRMKSTANALTMAGLAHTYAVSGRKTEARKLLAELQRLSEQLYVSAADVALVYAGLGEKDKAFTWLDKVVEEHSFSLAYVKTEPRFDPLRSDPRFADLRRRVGLSP